ncbi:hypothetical protein M3P05_10005 [Sansalvadorimonas sp. 2012CJ34-2]|uniref:Restriction endonuclease type IV Mrr domain-containing protein n=1 Tax=Parendozoicomonas callyspongiae TaxID=2942213 RepID=A0ABT0PFW2_9GAMM|nr:hypothetical protein [Sansalvadorimonas sp. 2012CJ34-2]MCL6270254.1 hypothetical protein [Sansalvadorimonas sp. 2012CJ34-2]
MVSTGIESGSLAQFDFIMRSDPELQDFLNRRCADTYEEFIGLLYRDLDYAISQLEENRHLHYEAGEDQLTVQIQSMLRMRGYAAEHDASYGGNCDLVVRSRNNFVWLGEAKIGRSKNNIDEGYRQLTTRYATGTDSQKEGGLIIYFQTKNAKSQMDDWKDRIHSVEPSKVTIKNCELKQSAFFSTHTLEASGQPYRIRHIPVVLHFDPKDKSGRNRKKR